MAIAEWTEFLSFTLLRIPVRHWKFAFLTLPMIARTQTCAMRKLTKGHG
jgi:hypothetical protein